MSAGSSLAAAAAAFIGVRFRLHGREPSSGLDCIGLLHASMRAIGRQPLAPRGYSFRNTSIDHLLGFAQRSGLIAVKDAIAAGDVLLTVPGPHQHHILIADEQANTVIHAHAGLRRIVRQSFIRPHATLAHWRLTPIDEDI